ncbi:hypothetical protein BDR04DRAFT_1150751 [Suillus decipiens]|nr:hypothetical protein BDR04DRAFT_1150751 [Suillus decipiens]
MVPIIGQFSFTNLPAELALLILRCSTQDTFDKTDKYEARSPYSSILALCLLSKFVRRIALTELLHTILLPKLENLRMFVDALSLLTRHRNDIRDWKINAFDNIGRGKECIQSGRVPSKVSHSPVHFLYDSDYWGRILAYGLCA